MRYWWYTVSGLVLVGRHVLGAVLMVQTYWVSGGRQVVGFCGIGGT